MIGSLLTRLFTTPRASQRALSVLLAVALALGSQVFAPAPARADRISELKSQLADMRKDVQRAADAWDAASTHLESTQARIKKIDRRLKIEAKNLRKAETKLGTRADAMYRGGGQAGVLDFVLGAATWDDFVSRMDYITMIASADAGLIASVKDYRVRLEESKVKYQETLVTQTRQAAEAKRKTNAMDAAFAAKKNQYDRILAAIAAEWARTHPKGGSSYPPGPNGMVFPVQGPCAYSDTWGAPRSGGRTHKGTDIMARRGTPCVATCAGVVRVHYNGLGGKSITLTGNNGWQFYYAHLNSYAVRNGARVRAGQLIGTVGNTGNAAGGACHLHFQMGPHGNWVDPYRYLRGMQ